MKHGLKWLAGAASLLAIVFSGNAGATELKVAHFMSPLHHMQVRVLEPMSAELDKQTDGELKLRIFPSGELNKNPATQWKAALTGITDIAFGLPGYTTETFPRTMLAVSPGMFTNAEEATNAIWDNIDSIAPDFQRSKMLAVWGSELAVLMTRSKPVRTIADVKGLKIRTADQISAHIIEAWGGTPVPLPASEIYTAMDTGVIDGLFIDPSGVPSFRLEEVANHVTIGLPTPSSAFFLVMNQGAWDRLDDKQKTALESVSGRELSLQSARSYAKDAQKGMEILKAKNREIIELDAAALKEFQDATAPISAMLIKEAEGRNVPDAAAITEALRPGN